MSIALTLSTLISTALLGAPPVPCPEGQQRAPVGVVDGLAARGCGPAETDESTRASTDDAARYAAMEETASPKVAEFRGGSTEIYVSTGAGIIILVVLLVILL